MFTYTPIIIDNLEKSLSRERLHTYLQATRQNKANALKLYLWNTKASAAFYAPLQCLEITLRNALHYQLTALFNTDSWYENITLIPAGRRQIQKAQDSVQRSHGIIDPPHMVAELSFGFWVSLLSKRYHQTLWEPVLHKALPHAQEKRSEINKRLHHLRILRNRIAHHEPIFNRHLEKDYQSILTAISWICPDTAKWTNSCHVVCDVLSEEKPS
ncbi:MAG: Abi family protein [Alphaproteobacteria bacterium]